MLASFSDVLAAAASERRAVAAFTSYDLETAVGVLEAARSLDRELIVLVSDEAFRRPSGPTLVAALRAAAEIAPVPVCIQLDHVDDLGRMEQALAAGVGALMADGSKLPFEENVALVADAVALARRHGAGVEAELGHIAGNEEVAEAVSAGGLTDPDQAVEFAERTGADCLAVSIGNVHGRYRTAPRLDWNRLAAIRSRLALPLSLHGASGLAGDDVRRAIGGGIVKINVNTELRARVFATLETELSRRREKLELLALSQTVIADVGATAEDLLRGFTLLA